MRGIFIRTLNGCFCTFVAKHQVSNQFRERRMLMLAALAGFLFSVHCRASGATPSQG